MAAPWRELTGLRRAAAAAARPPVPGRRCANELCLAPFHHRAPRQQQQEGRRRRQLRRGVKAVAAISEDLPRLAAPGKKGAVEGGGRPEKVLMRAALTVRRKQKEDLKEALAGHLDALWDMVGQSVALELISTKILLFPAVFAFAVGETKFLPLPNLLFTRGKLATVFPFCTISLKSVLSLVIGKRMQTNPGAP